MILSANFPVTLRHPGKRPINEALMIRSNNLPVTLSYLA